MRENRQFLCSATDIIDLLSPIAFSVKDQTGMWQAPSAHACIVHFDEDQQLDGRLIVFPCNNASELCMRTFLFMELLKFRSNLTLHFLCAEL